jgi:putative peptide zinc metalloprotease protein
MADSFFSPSWYRVAGLKPRLRSHVEIHRHHYRGELWYVLQDHSSGRFQRFTPAANLIIGLMDGRRTVQEIWDASRARLGEDVPTQEEVIRLLSQLHSADLLQSDVMPDTSELVKRYEKRRQAKRFQNLRSPLFVRFHILDPERFLNRFQWLARPFFSWFGAVVWLATVGFAVFLAALHWPELTENITDRILAPSNLAILWLTFPFLKAFHEFGHGFAVKTKGGEVHDMGIMLLVFTPIPYVDASASSAFREKKERVVVGAAGMAVELFLAAIAMMVWVSAEPGPVRAVAYNVIFIAGVSSILFNGNPLLRYDAYYILSDLIEIPNLGTRGTRYVIYLLQRYLLGIRDAEEPMASRGEKVWFIVYSVAAFCYRMFIYAAIVLFVATKFFFIGVMFACWALITMFVWPAVKIVRFLSSSPKVRRRRFRAVAATVTVTAGLAALVTMVPVPLSTMTEGVVWAPDDAFVRAGVDGFVERLVVPPGSRVKPGQPLVECSDPLLPPKIRVLESQIQELEALYDAEMVSDRVKADRTRKEIEHVRGRLEDAFERAAELTVRSPCAGVFVVPIPQDLPGSFLRRGELLGYLLGRGCMSVRVVVDQADADLVRGNTRAVHVRFPEEPGRSIPAVVTREVPAATDQMPGRALTSEGGGRIAVDPRDDLGIKSFQKVFLFDIELPEQAGYYNVGGKVHARFDHGKEPVVWRWYREIRRLFLRRFNV